MRLRNVVPTRGEAESQIETALLRLVEARVDAAYSLNGFMTTGQIFFV
jgi:hypothetical protein